MSIAAWALLWKIVLLGGVGVFLLLAVLVTIGGAADIRKMFAQLRKEP